jgi:hypothetical protein
MTISVTCVTNIKNGGDIDTNFNLRLKMGGSIFVIDK